MINVNAKLIAAAGLLMLICPPLFAGSEPAPGTKLNDGTPVIKQVKLSIAPAVGLCGGGDLPYSGVNCVSGDLTIAGVCEGLPVIAALRGFPLEALGLDAANEDITEIVEDGLEGRLLINLGSALAVQNPDLNPVCRVLVDFGIGRDYEIRKVKKFVNRAGVISAEMQLVPQD